jgi:hypothetical protein
MWDAWRLKHAVETIDIRMVNRIFAAIEASGGAIKAARSSAIVPDDAIGSP